MFKTSVQLPEEIIKEMDKHIDKIHVRNRSHLILIAITGWLNHKKDTTIPVDLAPKKRSLPKKTVRRTGRKNDKK